MLGAHKIWIGSMLPETPDLRRKSSSNLTWISPPRVRNCSPKTVGATPLGVLWKIGNPNALSTFFTMELNVVCTKPSDRAAAECPRLEILPQILQRLTNIGITYLTEEDTPLA